MKHGFFAQAARPILAVPALALGLLALSADEGRAASAQTRCETMVDGRVAWNRHGSTNWRWDNVKILCRGSHDPYETIACFNAGIRRHDDFQRAVNDCTSRRQARRAPPPPPAPPARKKSIYEMSSHEFLYGTPAPRGEIRSGGYGLPVAPR